MLFAYISAFLYTYLESLIKLLKCQHLIQLSDCSASVVSCGKTKLYISFDLIMRQKDVYNIIPQIFPVYK